MKKMNIKISISKKIIGMVILPILFICLVVGIISANIIKRNITNEIEIQLKTGAFSIGQSMTLCKAKDEMQEAIFELYDYTNMDVTIFSKDERTLSTINGVIGTKMDSKIYDYLLIGKEYFTTNADVNGESYFGYYIPFFIEGEFAGATFTGISQADANRTITLSIVKIIGCILICGIVAIVISLILVRKMVTGIKELESTIETLSNNDLAAKYDKYEFEHDEIEKINNKAVDFAEHLNQIITKIKMSSNGLKDIASDLSRNVQITNDTCNQISQAVENVASGAVSQAEDTTNAANSITDMSEELGEIKNNTNDLHNISNSMNDTKNNA